LNIFIVVETGYPSSPYTLRPFTEPEVEAHHGAERKRRLAFNNRLSSIRVFIEHAFGLLKNRFLSLKDFGRHQKIQEVYRVIQALMVIHNLCIDWKDGEPLLEQGEGTDGSSDSDIDVDVTGYGGIVVPAEDQDRVPTYETDNWHRDEGSLKRLAMLDELFPLTDFLEHE